MFDYICFVQRHVLRELHLGAKAVPARAVLEVVLLKQLLELGSMAAMWVYNQRRSFLSSMKCVVGDSVPETKRLCSGENPGSAATLIMFPDLMKILTLPAVRRAPPQRRRADGESCPAGAYSQDVPKRQKS